MLPDPATISSGTTPARPERDPYGTAFRTIDVVVQLLFGYLAWKSLGLDDSYNRQASVIFRLPLIAWQLLSLLLSSLARDGAQTAFRAQAARWVFISLGVAMLLSMFGSSMVFLRIWFAAALYLSVPYLILSILSLAPRPKHLVRHRPLHAPTVHRPTITTEPRTRPHRVPLSAPALFTIRQLDLIAQALCIAVPLLITLRNQRPIHEFLPLAYPFLAGFQVLSALVMLCCWKDMNGMRSGLRIPHMILQALFSIAVLVHWATAENFHWSGMLYQPCAILLTAAYFVITFREWETLSRAAAATRRKRLFS